MKKALAILSVAVMLVSCEFITNLIHDDEVVARVAGNKLYRSDLEAVIPDGVSAEDSTNLALQYINTWSMELLYADVAQRQLSKVELDVSNELEEYRRALLKYRYEQRYINDRLDTAVTRMQIEEYYESHRDIFVLQVPVVKARFLDIMQESPNLEILRRKMSSDDPQVLAEADSMAWSSALRYEDKSDTWVDMPVFARYFGTDYGSLLARMGSDGYIDVVDERGDRKIAYVCDILRAGAVAPQDYCEPRIREIIISNRKRELLSTLERDLLHDALERNTLEIY